eukprot:6465665-Amphidinium_carterae.1
MARAWYTHKAVFTELIVPLQKRFAAVTGVCTSTLFWCLHSTTLQGSILDKVNTQALQAARLTAGMRRAPGQTMADFYQDSTALLRAAIGGEKLQWRALLVRQQGALIGHCLRLPRGNPEREVLMWRNYTWSRMNAILPPYTRVMQFTLGP